MDHHCPFVGNCVGIGNHKTFWNFLFYASLGSCQVAISLLFLRPGSYKDAVKELNDNGMLFCVASFAFAMGFATLVLLWSTTAMLLRNRTTIENQTLLTNNPFDKGIINNLKEVMGQNWLLWLLPMKSDISL